MVSDFPRKTALIWSVGAAFLLIWAAISWFSSPSLDAYGDMVENYAWSQAWALGTFRHPPLFAWIVGGWFELFPTRPWAYYLLSYVNAGLGLLGIVWLARLGLPKTVSAARRDVFVMAVLLFGALGLPYSNLAAKFNADTVLLSLWPWTAYAFFAALHARDRRPRLLFAVLFGVLATAAMLGKYYSAMLLAALFVISIAHAPYRRWYRSPYPYVAVAVFAALVLPHAIWEYDAGMPVRQYLGTKIDASMSVPRILLFLLSAIYYWPASWLSWLYLRTRFAVAAISPVRWVIATTPLVLLCSLPALLTILFNVFARVHLTTHWAIPVWFALPVLLGRALLPHVDEAFAWRKLMTRVAVLWVALLAGGVAYTGYLSATGDPRYSLAREQMANTIDAHFASRFPAQQLAWVGGTWPESGAVAFFAPNHPRAVPDFPDQGRALITPYREWPERFGVIVCVASDAYAREGAHNADCESQARAWLAHHNLPQEEETLTYHAEGWRYIRAQPKNVTVFWVPPAREKL